MLLYKAQAQVHPLDSVQRRAVRIVDDPILTSKLEPLDVRRDSGSLFVFYRLYNGECPEELFDLVPTAQFRHHTTRRGLSSHPYYVDPLVVSTRLFERTFLAHTIRMWESLGGPAVRGSDS